MRVFPAVLALSWLATPAMAAEPGNLWEITTSMEGGGMSMPATTSKVCTPENAEGPEAMSSGGDNRCQVTDVQRTASSFKYKLKCPEGSGTGEMTYQGKDSFTQTMTMTMEGMTMKMSTKGKRLGSCDGSQMKKQIAAAQAQGAAALDQVCSSAVTEMMPSYAQNYQCDAKYKKQLCDRFGTRDGFRLVAARQPTGQAELDSGNVAGVSTYCGVQAEPIRERLCNDANRTEDLEFLGEQCPLLAQPIAQRECAGRDFTTPPAPKYRTFCSNYARALLKGEGNSTPAGAAKDAVLEGAKRLKGIFGR